MRPALITTVLAVTLTAGCGAATSTAPADTARPAAAAPSASTAAPMSRQAAAKYYLAVVKPWNSLWDDCIVVERWGEYTPAMERRALAACRKLPGVLTKMIHELEHPPAPWPAEARAAMQDLIDSDRALNYCIKQLRDVTTVGGYFQASQSCPNQSGDRSADIVRAHLGLPAVPK
ncbi:MAG TPA: hypothetical protein VE465_02165 [Streptosporangiaceae bacterium]|jgi:hypothetical protein|nr:hypothetical protein [Streptosporangiaceae bacterium]